MAKIGGAAAVDRSRRAAIYVRISADREGRELGVARQEEDCRALAERLGWDVVAVFPDNDISASSRSVKRRPQYEQMLSAVDDGRVDAVLAYSTSRLTRRPREFEDLIGRAERGLRISTVAAGEVDLSSANGRAMARTLAAFDAREAEENGERAARAKEQRRQLGLWHGGNRPFGFDRNGTTPNEDEQALIVAGCDAVLAGRSVGSIARMWTDAGAKPPQGGKEWSGSIVSEMLRRPRLAGLLPDGRPAQWAPVVPEDRWRAVQAVLSDPARRHRGGPRRLLTGLAECYRCDAGIRGGIERHGRPTYRCGESKHLERLAGAVDRYVVDVLLRHLVAQSLVPASADDDAGRLAAEAIGLRARLDEAADLFAAGSVTGGQLARVTNALRAELAATEASLAAAAGTAALVGVPLDEPGLRAFWGAADIERRRAILRAANLRIRLLSPGRGRQAFDPGTVQILAID